MSLGAYAGSRFALVEGSDLRETETVLYVLRSGPGRRTPFVVGVLNSFDYSGSSFSVLLEIGSNVNAPWLAYCGFRFPPGPREATQRKRVDTGEVGRLHVFIHRKVYALLNFIFIIEDSYSAYRASTL